MWSLSRDWHSSLAAVFETLPSPSCSKVAMLWQIQLQRFCTTNPQLFHWGHCVNTLTSVTFTTSLVGDNAVDSIFKSKRCCHAGTQLVAAIHHVAWGHQHTYSQDHPLGLLCGGVCLCNSQQWQPLHRLLAVRPYQSCLAENLDSFGSPSAHVLPAGSFSSSQVRSLSTDCLLSGPTNPASQGMLIQLAVPALIFILLAAFQTLRYAASQHVVWCQGLSILPHQSCLINPA